MNQLRALATVHIPDPPFPPPPDANFIKATEEIACSSQPTVDQVVILSQFGFKSIICLSSPAEPAFLKSEESLVKNQDLVFVNIPCPQPDDQSLCRALAAVRTSPKPCLIHDDIGDRAAIVTLLHVSLDLMDDLDATISEIELAGKFVVWGLDMGLDLNHLAKAAVAAFRLELRGKTGGL